MDRGPIIVDRAERILGLRSKPRFKVAPTVGRLKIKGYERLVVPEPSMKGGAILKRRDFIKMGIAAGLLDAYFFKRTACAKLARGGGALNTGFLLPGHWITNPLPQQLIYPLNNYTTFTGAISNGSGAAGTILTATSVSGTLQVGHLLGVASGLTTNTIIIAQTSGPTGGAGTYTVSNSQLVAATAMSAGVEPWAHHNVAYYDGTHNVPSIIPLGVQGLSKPVVALPVEVPAGVALGMVWLSNANASGPNYQGYLDLVWSPQESFSSGSPAQFAIDLCGQENDPAAIVEATWQMTTSNSTSVFLFADCTATSAGSGSITSPLGNTATGTNVCGTPANNTLQNIYGLTQNAVTPYQGAQLILRGNNSGVSYLAYDQTSSSGVTANGNKNPLVVRAMPGDPVPNISICQLASTISSYNHIFGIGATSSDLFFQGFSTSGVPDVETNGFQYFIDDQAANHRAVWHNLSSPNTFAGANTTSATASFVCYDQAGGGTGQRYCILMKGLMVTNLTATGGEGATCGYYTYNCTNALAQFCSSSGSNGVGFLWKDTNSYCTREYMYSQGQNWPFETDAFLISGAAISSNSNMEDSHCTLVGVNGGSPTLGYNQQGSPPLHLFGAVYIYRCSVVNGCIGIGQDASLVSGPYVLTANAVQFDTTFSQGIIFSTGGSSWAGGAFPANVSSSSNGSPNCQVSTGLFDVNNNLTGIYAVNAGEVGAQIL
jgi:hypothetical protein